MSRDPNRNADERRTAAVIVGALLLVGAITIGTAALLLPEAIGAMQATFAPGMGLKTATLIGFGVTVCVLVVFAVAAGDGLIGELPVMLGGFFVFWVLITLMLAWAL